MVAAYAEGCLDDGDGEGLTAIAEIGHVAALRLEQFSGGVFTIGRNQTVEVVLYGLEVRLAVPEGVVGIEGDDTDITQVDHLAQCGQTPLSI